MSSGLLAIFKKRILFLFFHAGVAKLGQMRRSLMGAKLKTGNCDLKKDTSLYGRYPVS